MTLRLLRPRLEVTRTTLAPPPKEADPHYQTAEHRAWARQVIARAGYQCEGWPLGKACWRSGVRLFADHVRELKDGGAPFDVANGRALCGSCHTAKTAKVRAERTRAIVG